MKIKGLKIVGGWVWPGVGLEPIKDGAVLIEGDRIAAVGPAREMSTYGTVRMGGPDRLIMPGLVNGHAHLPMTLFRGLADDLELMDWLRNHIWPAEAASVDEKMVYWAGLLGLAEMIRSGTTTVCDSYFCQTGMLRAIREAGLRGLIAQGNIDFPAPGVPDPAAKLEVSRNFLEAGRDLSPLIRTGLFCHAPYTCGPETLAGVKELADEFGAPVLTHLSETAAEDGLIREAHGHGPAEYLDRAGFLGENTILVHGVHLQDREIKLLAERSCSLITCPESNMKLASGRARVEAWLAAGIKVGLGTDGAASNNDLNLFGEMGSLARLAKVEGDPTALPAETVLDLATSGGADALGFDNLGFGNLGRLIPGAPADLIGLDLTAPNLFPLHNIPAQLVYAAHGAEVRDSIVNGRVLMQDRQLKSIDLDRVKAKVGELMKGL